MFLRMSIGIMLSMPLVLQILVDRFLRYGMYIPMKIMKIMMKNTSNL